MRNHTALIPQLSSNKVIKAKEGLCVSDRPETHCYRNTLHDMGLLSSFLFSKQYIFVSSHSTQEFSTEV